MFDFTNLFGGATKVPSSVPGLGAWSTTVQSAGSPFTFGTDGSLAGFSPEFTKGVGAGLSGFSQAFGPQSGAAMVGGGVGGGLARASQPGAGAFASGAQGASPAAQASGGPHYSRTPTFQGGQSAMALPPWLQRLMG